jgi:hypothetical protein
MASYIDKNIQNIFPLAKQRGLSALELMKYLEDEPKQWNVIISQKLSYDGVKSFLSFEANNFLESYCNANLRVLNPEEVLEIQELKGKAFDVVFSLNGEVIPLEIKINQKSYSNPDKAIEWQGATHATKKVDDYLLISLDFDSRKKVIEDSGYIKGFFVILTSLRKSDWIGEASETSSRTTLRLPPSTPDTEVLHGQLIREGKRRELMYCKINYESLNQEEHEHEAQQQD